MAEFDSSYTDNHLILHGDGRECEFVSTEVANDLVARGVCKKIYQPSNEYPRTIFALELLPGQHCPTCKRIE